MTNDQSSSLAISIGGDDMGAAWLIAIRSPSITLPSLAIATKRVGKKDLRGVVRLRKDETPAQYDERIARREMVRSESKRDNPASQAAITLGSTIRAELGELGEWLADGVSASDCADRLGIHRSNVSRRLSAIATKYEEIYATI